MPDVVAPPRVNTKSRAYIAAQEAAIIADVRAGLSRGEAAIKQGIRPDTLYERTSGRPDLKAALDEARADYLESIGKKRRPRKKYTRKIVDDFVTFRLDYFGHETTPHQLEWWEAMASSDDVLILVPPGHGKTTFMEEYVIWRICSDRNVKILFICKNQETAKSRLWRIKRLLTEESEYDETKRNLVKDYGPFKSDRYSELPWSATQIYVEGSDASGRDPTVEAVGIGNNIQGNRTDVAIPDDAFTLENQFSESEREKQRQWLTQTVISRRRPNRPLKVIIIGTRANPQDNYGVLLDDPTMRSVVQQAIIDEQTQQTLWPDAWPYEVIDELRQKMEAKGNLAGFLLTFQQQATDLPDAPFKAEFLEASKQPMDYAFGSAPSRLRVVIGVDPAVSGTCAITVLGIDPETKQRWILDCLTAQGLTANERIKAFVYEACRMYRPVEAKVERNSQQSGIWEDGDFRMKMREFGCRITSEQTQIQKYDPEVGVTICASRFEAGRYIVPWNFGTKSRFQPLFDELLAWRAIMGRRQTQDRVMSLWLAELAAMNAERLSRGVPPPDKGVNKHLRRNAYELTRRGASKRDVA